MAELYNLTESLRLLKARDYAGFQKTLRMEVPPSFPHRKAFLHWINAQDLTQLLHTTPHCACFFHEDHKPSASLYQQHDRWYYVCHAGCTQQPLSLVGIYEKLQDCNFTVAMDELAQFFGTKIEDTGPLRGFAKPDFLEQNREIIAGICTKAPQAYSILGVDLEALEAMMSYAETHSMPYKDGALISLSGGYLQSLVQRSIKPSRTLAVLQYFGLIHRLTVDEIPAFMLGQLERYAEEQYQQMKSQGQEGAAAEFHRYKRLISQTVLFPLDESLYAAQEEAAARWRTYGHTKPNLSFAQLAQEDLLLALQCFPQTKGIREE